MVVIQNKKCCLSFFLLFAGQHQWCELKCLNEMCTEWQLKLILQISDSFHFCCVLYDSSETALRHPDRPIRQQFACPARSICLVHVSIKQDNLDLDLRMTLQSYQRRELYSHCPRPLRPPFHWKGTLLVQASLSFLSNLFIKFLVWSSKLLATLKRLLIVCTWVFSPNRGFGVCGCFKWIEVMNMTESGCLVRIDASPFMFWSYLMTNVFWSSGMHMCGWTKIKSVHLYCCETWKTTKAFIDKCLLTTSSHTYWEVGG